MKIKIAIADDHPLVINGLHHILGNCVDMEIIGSYPSGKELLLDLAVKQPDVLLLDISMPGRNGMEILKQLRAENVKAPILVLTMHQEDVYGPRVLKAGANGFLNKEMATEELVAAVHRVLAGRKYISGALAEKLAESLNDNTGKPAHETRSDREMQVLQLLASGKTVSDVANELSLSVNTISTYRNRLLEKLTLHNNAELTRYALDNNLA